MYMSFSKVTGGTINVQNRSYILVILLVMVVLQGQIQTTFGDQSLGFKLNHFVRDMQLKYVERSYSASYKDCFTYKDLALFSKNIKPLQTSITQEPVFAELKQTLSKLPFAQREALYTKALAIKSPTWEVQGVIDSNGQTLAGQKAEQLVATTVISCLKSTTLKTQAVPQKALKLVWQDEFTSEGKVHPNPSNWNYDLGGNGWGNGELEYYTDSIDNAFVENGFLNIQVIPEPYKNSGYTSARLVTRDLASWNSGRVEVRAKLPFGQGIWPAIWMLPENDTYGTYEKNGEIDIMEMVGHDPKTVYGSLHFDVNNRLHSAINTCDTARMMATVDYSKDFHLFAVEWDANWMRWSVDGHPYASIKMSKLFTDPTYKPFNQPFYLVMNVAVGGTWPGSPDDSTRFPQKMTVDYVRVYQDVK